jgi:hypothetical protein
MGQLSAEQVNWLETTFGDRMTTRRVERKLYSHDVGEMPMRWSSRNLKQRSSPW